MFLYWLRFFLIKQFSHFPPRVLCVCVLQHVCALRTPRTCVRGHRARRHFRWLARFSCSRSLLTPTARALTKACQSDSEYLKKNLSLIILPPISFLCPLLLSSRDFFSNWISSFSAPLHWLLRWDVHPSSLDQRKLSNLLLLFLRSTLFVFILVWKFLFILCLDVFFRFSVLNRVLFIIGIVSQSCSIHLAILTCFVRFFQHVTWPVFVLPLLCFSLAWLLLSDTQIGFSHSLSLLQFA